MKKSNNPNSKIEQEKRGINASFGKIISLTIGIFSTLIAVIFLFESSFSVFPPHFERISGTETMGTAIANEDGYALDCDFCAWDGRINEKSKKTIASLRAEKLSRPAKVKSAVSLSAVANDSGSSGFKMIFGASVRVDEVTGIRFQAEVPSALAQEVEASPDKSFGIAIAPAFYFQKAEELFSSQNIEGNTQVFDYVSGLSALEASGAMPALKINCRPIQKNGITLIQGSVAEVLYKNTNLEFMAIAYVASKSENNEISYRYASFNVQENADIYTTSRSVAYVANAALTDEQMQYSEESKAILKGLFERGLAQAAGLSEEEVQTWKVKGIDLSVTNQPLEKLKVGESYEASATVTMLYVLNGEETNTAIFPPIYWKSSAPEVIKTGKNGELTALSEGSAVITARVGDTEVQFVVECEKDHEYNIPLFELVNISGYDILEVTYSEETGIIENEFTATIKVKDYACFGEISFRIGDQLCTTANGEYDYRRTIAETNANAETQTEIIEISKVSTDMDCFEYDNSRLYKVRTKEKYAERKAAKGVITAIYPTKVILPEQSEEGKTLTAISGKLDDANHEGALGNMTELVIPETYSEFLSAEIFRYCAKLEKIYVRYAGVCKATGPTANAWSGCNALTNIYVCDGYVETYKENSFWRVQSAKISGTKDFSEIFQ